MDAIRRKIELDGYSREELAAFDLARRLNILDGLCEEIMRLTDLKCDAIDLRTEARFRGDKDGVERAKADIEKINAVLSGRREQKTTYQTILRSPAA